MGVEGKGRTVVVTGGSAGLGYECARGILASGRGWRVILACRDVGKGERAVDALVGVTGNREVEALPLDLASLASVRSFVRELCSREDLTPLGAVVCNAGLQVVSGTTRTEDGFETTFGVNHLSHFLLTNLLLERLSRPARVVFVSSGTHDPKRRTGMPAPVYREARRLAFPWRYQEEADESVGAIGRRRYTNSKLCNVMCAYELDRRLRDEMRGGWGLDVSVNAFDPGWMPETGLVRDYGPVARFVATRIFPRLLPLGRRLGVNVSTVETSGEALARLVTDPTLGGVSGRYFEVGGEARSSDQSYDRDKAAELWETSAGLVGLKPEETPLRVATSVLRP